ncbi:MULTISPECIES: efflux RND transporter periplasmic adaptor subunit [unclassified Pseudomonas]|uniref:efflux RND transporter periplasmic adaptor subunit n=1 Tax=unclassified Pseudomonas TaxID=196821 RepID=UPI0008E4912E|nr:MULTISPECIES: efflux RND transporter periplasmic adaptor subunit [unclassified Pseudomonas]SFI29806.1 membrane fusion protein, Cu(I)/Ag(I) efflux system [Pseudomonas sp. NFPP04]SFJ12430.1 membrane fusion protein, Cu(I)/Ag(I) efflux system [Pseudomonas sp. NFPP11]SFP34873.1 membrane fusion protein, Cu(I)/Ag(I) efflux system [Pseudomonas sp. NFPP28]
MNNSIVAAVLLLGLGAGYGLAQWQPGASSMPAKADRRALYWYDPMFPQQQFDKPGKSPFMDMQLVPRYADGAASAATPAVQIDPGLAQNIGVRLASVSRGVLTSRLELSGILAFNERDVAVVQARAAGFVERVYARAPGDVLKAGAPLVDLLIPEWAAAQEEFLALRRSGERGLIDAARQRLRLSGMPAGLIAQMERSGQVQSVLTVTSPISGALQTLEVREGMTVTPGQTLARFNGLDQVWLQVAVPEAQGAMLNVGQRVQSHFVGLPGKTLDGTVSAILPATAMDSRTVQVRVELPNPDGALRPGMTAQVSLAQTGGQALLQVPSEALIRTGKRVLVMLAEEGGHYRPVEVETGVENQDHTVILSGLQEGQQVVASGQFLLDSEASLKGVTATAAEAAMNMQPGAQP